jgi:hypothetical protein
MPLSVLCDPWKETERSSLGLLVNVLSAGGAVECRRDFGAALEENIECRIELDEPEDEEPEVESGAWTFVTIEDRSL